jgi:ribosomal protein L35
LEKKSQKKKRAFDKAEVVAENDVREVKRLLGGFRRTK